MKIPGRLLLLLALTMLGTGCAEFQLGAERVRRALPVARPGLPESFWRGDGVSGSSAIVISLSEQRAYFYKGRAKQKNLVGESTISTGRKGFETPPGHYRVIQKDADHVSSLYGDYVDEDGEVVKRNVDVNRDPRPPDTVFRGASMPYFLRFTRGYGLHAGYLPGYRASHGCIRMPRVMARHFFHAADIGTPVTVKE
jgi:lipoprotein-anchoring transpeptidase ErfK/SrfK